MDFPHSTILFFSTVLVSILPISAVSEGLEKTAPIGAVILTAQQVHAAAKDSVFRLSTRLENANSRAEHGTAFVIDTGGLLVTNYHVVRDAMLSKEKMQLRLEMPDGDTPASVVAVDVVNDLALVKVNRVFAVALPIANSSEVAEGEVVYSMGFPANDQLTFAQGNYGGEKLVGFVTSGFASLPLNGGMSGGPMLNAHAAVIGVNRAMITQAQNLSMFSPLGALKEIIARKDNVARDLASDSKKWSREVVAAISKQESIALANKQTIFKKERLGKVSFSVPLPNQSCGQAKMPEKIGMTSNAVFFTCQSRSLTPLSGRSNALEVMTLGYVSENGPYSSVDPLKMVIQSYYNRERGVSEEIKKDRAIASIVPKSENERENCGLKNVKNVSGVAMTVSYCSLANATFNGLFSTFVRIEIHSESAARTSLAQFYEGLTAETTADVLEKFLDSVTMENNS